MEKKNVKKQSMKIWKRSGKGVKRDRLNFKKVQNK